MLQSSARLQLWGAEQSNLHEHWFFNKCLCLGKTEYGEKRQRSFQSIYRDAGQAAVQRNHQCQWGSVPPYRARKTGSCTGSLRQKARNHTWIRSMDLHFELSAKDKFCVSPFCIPCGSDVTRWKQVFFIFFYCCSPENGWQNHIPARRHQF